VVERLAASGVAAEVVDHPGPIALWFSFGTYRVRIAVDEADEARARAVLAAWSTEARPRVDALARSLTRDALLSALPALALAALLLWGGPWAQFAAILAVPAAWLGGMVLLARRRRAGPPG
jgi:hypothetical protein